MGVNEDLDVGRIDARPEAERVWDRFRNVAAARSRLLAEARTNRVVDHLLERQAELAGAPP
jgi:hypothetical protein